MLLYKIMSVHVFLYIIKLELATLTTISFKAIAEATAPPVANT